FGEEILQETNYYIENGLRHIRPYNFTFTTHAKGRWVGKKLIDIFKNEFSSSPVEYYINAIQNGKITVNNKIPSANTIVRDNDVIRNTVHRHEPPVTANPIQIIKMDDDIVVINKPASIPVHPCGRYRHNSVVFMLARDYGLQNLHTIHRLDRLTSGILIFARTLQKAQELEKQVRDRQIEKQYVCRVDGEFPTETIDCKEPIDVVSHKLGVCRVSPKGKSCQTIFQRLSYNGKTSLVKCIPLTGRMHQIRVHLQWLGYPIVNDPIYNHEAWGPNKGKAGHIDKDVDSIVLTLLQFHRHDNVIPKQVDEIKNLDSVDELDKDNSSSSSQNCENISQVRQHQDNKSESHITTEKIQASEDVNQSPMVSPLENNVHQDCVECRLTYKDPTPEEMVLWLHALKYKGPDWEFEAKLPEWSLDN
ncbi:uncharacterized protein TRIADDRAFT_1807, partial [Trichoplax adhaerens]